MQTTGDQGQAGKAPMHLSLPPYPDRFYAAARYAAVPGTVEMTPGTANTTPYTDLTCLALYSLYQQAVQGPCKGPKPWAWNLVELAKWQSWRELGNMPPMEAMRLFVRALEEEDPDWWSKAQELEAAAAAEDYAIGEGAPLLGKHMVNGDVPAAGLTSPRPLSPLAPVVTSLANALVEAASNASTQWVPVPVSGRKPAARYQHAATVMGDKMVLVAGNTGRFVSDVHLLDLPTLTWSKLELSTTDNALPPCAGHALVTMDDNTVLVIGGHQKDTAASLSSSSSTTSTDKLCVRALDLDTHAWRVLKTRGQVPAARGGHSVCKVGSMLWLFGGEDAKRHILGDVYSLDLNTLVWDQVDTKGTVPSPRADHCATVYNERYLTVFGGGSHSFCFNDVHVLDLDTSEWTKAESFGSVPSPRAGHVGVPIGSCWFVVGGGDNKCGVSETMVLELDTLNWSVVCNSQQRTPIASEGLSVVPVESPQGTLLLAFGGYNGKYNNELLVLRPDTDKLAAMTPSQRQQNGTSSASAFSSMPSTPAPASQPPQPPTTTGEESATAASMNGAAAAAPAGALAPVSAGLQSEAITSESGYLSASAGAPAAAPSAFAATPSAGAAAGAEAEAVHRTGSAAALPPVADVGRDGSGGGHAMGAADFPTPKTAQAQMLSAQLEEASAAAARAEQIALNARAQASHQAAEARADAWLAIAKANKEVEEMREKVAQAQQAKQRAEDDLAEGTARVVAAQAAAAAAQAEAQKLRRDLVESRAKVVDLQADLLRIGSDSELSKVRSDYQVCKTALADAEQELQSVRASLSAEQSRCFRLEVEVAELRQRLSEMGDLQRELELLRRQRDASEAMAARGGGRSGWGLFGGS